MIVEESTARMLRTLNVAGPLMWASGMIPWEVVDLACLGLTERGPSPWSVQLTPLGRSYAVDILDGALA